MNNKGTRNTNGEGCIYNTIQKIDRKNKRLNFVCDICKSCEDWSICDNRTGTNKCQKCLECTACLKRNFCDRFYCYNRYPAQISIDGKQKTVANEKKKIDTVEKKKEIEAQVQTKTYVKKNGITIIEVCKKIGDNKFNAGKIIKSTKDKDQYHYVYIENWKDFHKPVQRLTYQEIDNFLNSIRHLSQRRNRQNCM